MPTKNSKFYSFILVLTDTTILLTAFITAYVVRVQFDDRPLIHEVFAFDYFVSFLAIIPIWIGVFAFLGLYNGNVFNRRLLEWSRIGIGVFIGILLVIGWEYIREEAIFPARLVAAYALIGSFVLIVLERELLRFIRSQMFRFGKGINRVLLIGSGETTTRIAKSLANTRETGYKVVAMAGPQSIVPDNLRLKHYSRFESALKELHGDMITTIIQTDLYDSPERNQKILSAAQSNHIAYSFIPGESEFYSGKNTVDVFLGYPMISVYQTPLVGWGSIFKRIFDLLIILLTIPLWVPVILITFFAQKILNPGPALFINTRLGRYGKKIELFKFRSMVPEYCGQDAIKIFEKMGRADLAQEYAKTRKITNDPRITKFGHFIRATSLDELPQIFNVIRGDMSLVGPRPILPDEKDFYKNRGSLLFSVKPGITGLWQVSGRSETNFEGRVDLELFYAQNWSFWLDIKILFKTLGVVLFGKGAK